MARRIFKKIMTLYTLLPIIYDKAVSKAARAVSEIIAGWKRELAVIIAFLVCAAVSCWLGVVMGGVLFLVLAVALVLRRAMSFINRQSCLHSIAANGSPSGLPSFRETLLEMKVDQKAIERVAAFASTHQEVLLGEFDQNNKVSSKIGEITAFMDSLVDQTEFQKRKRNGVQLVVFRDVVCVKKKYVNRKFFESEILALGRLQHLKNTPQVVKIDRRERVLYQSFLLGDNLGTLAAKKGAPVSVQHQAAVKYPGVGQWSEADNLPEERQQLVESLKKCVLPSTIIGIASLLERIHNSGVTVLDIKLGNVIVKDGVPFMCDFEVAKTYGRECPRFLRERERDRDTFNYIFSGDMLTEPLLRATAEKLGQKNKGLFYAPVYYGKGFEVGQCNSIEFGSGKWRFIKKYLPDVLGKRVLDLGSNNGVMPLEMLRAGATSVTGYEPDPTFAAFAKMNHKWFEFIDNRKYNFTIRNNYMREICDCNMATYDIVTAFCSLYYESIDNMKRIVNFLSLRVGTFVVQCNENPKEHVGEMLRLCSLDFLQELLRTHGFEKQEIVKCCFYDRPLIIAKSSCIKQYKKGSHDGKDMADDV